jgi:hypothetical protein
VLFAPDQRPYCQRHQRQDGGNRDERDRIVRKPFHIDQLLSLFRRPFGTLFGQTLTV